MNKKSKYGMLSKNTILFTINSLGTKIISFLLVPLYTYVLSTQDYGMVDLMTSTVSLLIPVLTLNIQDAVLRYALDDEANAQDVISIGIKYNFIGAVILAVALYFLSGTGVLDIDRKYVIFMYLSYILGGFSNSFSMYLRAKDKVSVFAVSGVLNTVLVCTCNVVLLIVFKMGINGYLISNILGSVSSTAIMFWAGGIYKDCKIRVNKTLSRTMVVYSLPLVLNSVAWWINNVSDKYILTWFCGVAVNGIYSVAYKIPTILSTLQTVFYNAWSVSAITEFDERDSDGFIGNIYTLYSCISIIGCSVIMLFNFNMAKILYAKDFFAAWKFVPFLLVGAVFNGIALFEGCLFTAVKKTKEVFKTTLMGALLNAVANIVLIPLYGAVGAAVATMIGYFTIWVVRTIYLRRIVKMKVKWGTQILINGFLLIQCFLAVREGTELFQFIFLILIIICQFKYIKTIIVQVLKKIKK